MKYTDSSARVFTNWSSNCQLNDKLKNKYNISNASAYRNYLQQNTEQIMKDLVPVPDKCKYCPVCNSALSFSGSN